MAIRTRIAEPDPAGPTLTDSVGDVVAVDDEHVTLATRRGEVRLALRSVVAARIVPARPSRRGAPHRAVSIEDLHLVMTKGNPGLEVEWLGEPGRGWLLRAGGGYTGRANSALPVGDPGMTDEEAAAATAGWYRERDLAPHVMLPLPRHVGWTDDPLGSLLVADGWTLGDPVLVMTGRSVGLAELTAPELTVTSEPVLTEEWLALASPRALARPEAARRVLSAPRQQAFLVARDGGGQPLGVARVALDDGWAGLFGVQVRPELRRQGIGAALTVAAGRHALEQGASLAYLQVEESNLAAVALSERAGLSVHHHYAYLALRPATP